MGLEWAHAKRLGESEGLAAVVLGGLLTHCRSELGCNRSEEAQGIRLVTLFLVRTGEHQRAFGSANRCRQPRSATRTIS